MKRILLGLLGLGAIIVILRWGRAREQDAFVDAWRHFSLAGQMNEDETEEILASVNWGNDEA